jgi:hypothetical protein
VPRQPELEIPLEEPLYRRISCDDVIGDAVQPCAVELPASSFNRARYSEPDAVLDSNCPWDNGVVQITGGSLPGPFNRTAIACVYEYFVADDPVVGNDAHCEVRMRRQGYAYTKNHKVKEVDAAAKEALARKMRVIKAPY